MAKSLIARDQDRDILLGLTGSLLLGSRAVEQELSEHLGFFLLVVIGADNDTRRMQVIIQRLGLSEEFRAENDIFDAVLLLDGIGIADGDGALDNHQDVGIHLERPFDRVLYRRGIEEVVHIVIVGRGSDHNQVRGAVSRSLIGSGAQVQLALTGVRFLKKALDLVILDRADELVELLRLGFGGGDRGHLVVLCQKNG